MKYDLEERTLKFARSVRLLFKGIPLNARNIDDIRQCTRSSGSVGANYREANSALGKKDFLMRIRICRKEAKETGYWLELIEISGKDAEDCRKFLLQESHELVLIFGAILKNSK